MWHYEFDAPVGSRILSSRFFGITQFSDADMWWSHTYKKWIKFDECNGNCSSMKHVQSFKAFKRHLKNHPELQACGEVVLVSKFIGHNIRAFWRGE